MSEKIENGQRIHVRLTKQQYARLKKLAAAGGYSISETLRRAIDAYLGS
ncbi:MAG: ribbon-helix-helix domain-containing protein [Steroidobacteraceae bacterium]|jgi:Arc/MetJ-type ribon-helix-helix transcriptional regulator